MPKIRRIHRGWIQVGEDGGLLMLVNMDTGTIIRVTTGFIPREATINGKYFMGFHDDAEARAFFDEIVGCLK